MRKTAPIESKKRTESIWTFQYRWRWSREYPFVWRM